MTDPTLHPAPMPTNVRALRQALETYDDDADVRLEYTPGDGVFEKGLPIIVIYLDDAAAQFATIWDGVEQPRKHDDATLEPITEHETRDDDDALATQMFLALAADEHARHHTIEDDIKRGEAHLLQSAVALHLEGHPAAAYAMILAAIEVPTTRPTTEETPA